MIKTRFGINLQDLAIVVKDLFVIFQLQQGWIEAIVFFIRTKKHIPKRHPKAYLALAKGSQYSSVWDYGRVENMRNSFDTSPIVSKSAARAIARSHAAARKKHLS